MWRISLRRMRADWPLAAAAWLITLLAAVLFASGLIYPSAAAEAGLRRALSDVDVASRSVEVGRYDDVSSAPDLDAAAMPVLLATIGRSGGQVNRDWRGTATLALSGTPGSKAGDQADVGFLDGLSEHATLRAGAFPIDSTGGDVVEAVLAAPAADALGLRVGDTVDLLANPATRPVDVRIRLVGIYTPTDAAEPFWNGDEQLITGRHENAQYRTFGPFLVTMPDLLSGVGAEGLRLRWRIFPDFNRLAVDDAGALRGGIVGIPNRLLVDTGRTFTLQSELPAILDGAERSLLVSRTSVILLMAQLALLAGYAIVLTASVLVDHRRVDTALLRARGAGSIDLGILALIEALLFAVTSVAIAPWLAAGAVSLFNEVGPLADVGLTLGPRVSGDSYIAAALAGALCVLLLVLPAALSARAFVAEQAGRSRQETRTFGQRVGLDLVLVVITAIALWQLRLYGAPLTRTVQGTLGLDPLLVAAPGIGLLAGGVLALRLMPLLAEAAQAAVGRSRGLVASLGSRQLARRPLRYTRSALLLMLAVSMGVFALSYAATWSGSQRDQAAYQAGADVRVTDARPTTDLPLWAQGAAIDAIPSVAAAMPVERVVDGIKFSTTGSSDLLALDAATASGIVLTRDDATATLSPLLPRLADARPSSELPALPKGSATLRVSPVVDIGTITRFIYDPETDTGTYIVIDPATVNVRVSASVILRDERGRLYRFESPVQGFTGAATTVAIPLRDATAASDLRLDGSVGIATLELEIWMPTGTTTSVATVGFRAVEASGTADGSWSDVPLGRVPEWTATIGSPQPFADSRRSVRVRDTVVDLTDGGDPFGSFSEEAHHATAVVTLMPTDLGPAGGSLPVIANAAFLDRFGFEVGDTTTATVVGEPTGIEIVGAVDTFPTTDPGRPLLVADAPTVGLLRLQTQNPRAAAGEWWLAAAGGDATALAADLQRSSLAGRATVVASDRARALSTDPVALGVIGALTLGFLTTALFAIVGLTASAAVAARQQRTEYALLRALGLSGRQLSASLWLENGSVATISVVAGTGLGLLVAWLVLPFIAVTQSGAAPVPPVLIDVPWVEVLALDAVTGAALAISVLLVVGMLRRLGVASALRMAED